MPHDPAVVQPCPLEPSGPHWLELVLVGEDGMPVPWERYTVTTPDGEVRDGFLDARGTARLEHIAMAGTCRVSFPDLDGAAWERTAATAEPAPSEPAA